MSSSVTPMATAFCGVAPPFEFHALEAVLLTASTELSRRQAALSDELQRALLALRRNVVGTQVVAGSRQLEAVRQLKQSVRELLVQSQALEEAIQDVLDEDEDMEAMYIHTTRLNIFPRTHVHDPLTVFGTCMWSGT